MTIPVHPEDDTWVAAVHAAVDGPPVGTAVVIDERRLLTCRHVLPKAGGGPGLVWVRFLKAADRSARRPRAVAMIRVPEDVDADVAVLELADRIPDGVGIAPVRRPPGKGLVRKAWWAFGFPDGDRIGDSAEGQVGADLAGGWIRLDTESGARFPVRPGFSGGGLWSPDYSAVVALVGQANANGDARAFLLRDADQCLPKESLHLLLEQTLPAAGELAMAAWGWSLAADEEGARHWKSGVRGATRTASAGRFRGRVAALTEIVARLQRPAHDRRVLVVTGSPGVGKSAVLGRIVTTADAGLAAALPIEDDGIRAPVGSIACAVHASSKTAFDVAREIARAASAPLPERIQDLAPALRDTLGEEPGRRFNLVIDALDEATEPAEARRIIRDLVLPIVQTCADVGAQVILGSRRRDEAGDLLEILGSACIEIDLDDPAYFAREDLAAYVHATLAVRRQERPDNPYSHDHAAAPLAARIAELAEPNFLVAGLIARRHGLYDTTPADPATISFTATIDAALSAYLENLPALGGLSAAQVLLALAFAEAPGLTVELWQAALQALHERTLTTRELEAFAGGSAANFLIETSTRGTATYRLFHRALSDTLLAQRAPARARTADEQALTATFLAHGRCVGQAADPIRLWADGTTLVAPGSGPASDQMTVPTASGAATVPDAAQPPGPQAKAPGPAQAADSAMLGHPPARPPGGRGRRAAALGLGAAVLIAALAATVLAVKAEKKVTTIPAAFAGNWTGDSFMPSERVNLTWRVAFGEGETMTRLRSGETSCASGALTFVDGTTSRIRLRFAPRSPCTPGDVTVTVQDGDRLLFEVDPDAPEEAGYPSILRRE